MNDIYVNYNKFIDKQEKYQKVYMPFFGNSILFSKTDELWAEKRKHLATAFYKDKLTPMLGIIIDATYKEVQEVVK